MKTKAPKAYKKEVKKKKPIEINIMAEQKCNKREDNMAPLRPSKTGIELSACALSKSSSCKAYKISKPETHVNTSRENISGSQSKIPCIIWYL